jgi:HSP20 family protein
MTMMRFSPYSPLSDIFQDLFGDTNKEKMEYKNYECAPSVNILENNNGFELQLAIPGVQKDDVKINLEKNVLSISSEKEAEKTDEQTKYTRKEFVYGTFCRTFTLPETIDSEKIGADFKDGILRVTLPKKAETKISKEIKIS